MFIYVYNEHADPTKIRLKKQEIKLMLKKTPTFFYIKKIEALYIASNSATDTHILKDN